MNELTTPAETGMTEFSLSREQVATGAIITQPGVLERLEKFAVLMAKGHATVPQHLRGNVGDCLAVSLQAAQWGMSPFAVAQKTHLINGQLGYEAQLVNAAINSLAPTKDRIHYEWFGPWEKIVGKFKTVESKREDEQGKKKTYRVPAWNEKDEEGLGVKVWATLKGEDSPRSLELLMAQARTRNSTLWADDPKQQIAYLAVKRWSRLYVPDVILGVYTPDELEDSPPPKNMGTAEVVENTTKPASLTEADLANWRAAAEKGSAEGKAFWFKQTVEWRKRAPQSLRDAMWAVAVEADKKRTVDNVADTGETNPAGSETAPDGTKTTNAAEGGTKPAEGETRTAKQDADPETGETSAPPGTASLGPSSAETADFVADMERAEREGRQP